MHSLKFTEALKLLMDQKPTILDLFDQVCNEDGALMLQFLISPLQFFDDLAKILISKHHRARFDVRKRGYRL